MKTDFRPLIRLIKIISYVLIVSFLGSCSAESWRKAFAAQTVLLSYDDLGLEEMVTKALGPRGTDLAVIVHHGSTNEEARPRRLNVHQGMFLLRHNCRLLPNTPENEHLRRLMARAYSQMYQLYRTRRDAMVSGPASYGRGGMGRTSLMPPMPSSI